MNNIKLKGAIAVFFLLFLSLSSFAQKGTIRGFIYNDKTGEAEIGATVFLKGTTFGAATDINGFYSITKIPEGTYTLSVTSIGFTKLEEVINLKKGDIIKPEDLSSKRPGTGIPPPNLDQLIGKACDRDILEGELIPLEMLET